jgi:hypothetical protein
VSSVGTGLVAWSLMLVMCSLSLISVLGSGRRRRSHFWMRALLLELVPALLPALLAVGASMGIIGQETLRTTGLRISVMCPLSLVLAPALLYRGSNTPPGDSRGDSPGGGGPGPDPPSDAPDPSDGGIPLPDADQSASRRRDHSGGWQRRRRPRRVTRERDRTPTPAP